VTYHPPLPLYTRSDPRPNAKRRPAPRGQPGQTLCRGAHRQPSALRTACWHALSSAGTSQSPTVILTFPCLSVFVVAVCHPALADGDRVDGTFAGRAGVWKRDEGLVWAAVGVEQQLPSQRRVDRRCCLCVACPAASTQDGHDQRRPPPKSCGHGRRARGSAALMARGLGSAELLPAIRMGPQYRCNALPSRSITGDVEGRRPHRRWRRQHDDRERPARRRRHAHRGVAHVQIARARGQVVAARERHVAARAVDLDRARRAERPARAVLGLGLDGVASEPAAPWAPSSPESAHHHAAGRPRPGPKSTATTKPCASTCTPCSTTSASRPSRPPHRQHLVDRAVASR